MTWHSGKEHNKVGVSYENIDKETKTQLITMGNRTGAHYVSSWLLEVSVDTEWPNRYC